MFGRSRGNKSDGVRDEVDGGKGKEARWGGRERRAGGGAEKSVLIFKQEDAKSDCFSSGF